MSKRSKAGYVVSYTWAGVRHGRGLSHETFADANRSAMASAVKLDRLVEIYTATGEFILSYRRGASGLAIVDRVGG